ncbi:MAG: SpoIID/LytB domain-containing protein, partial [Bacteroides sp.]|nr:SpoIID/LytB domain-containing protein [Bacteroides sp.]
MQLSDRYTSEPTVSVGILSDEVIRAELCGTYLCSGVEVSGPVEVRDTGDGSLEYDGAESFSLSFVPAGDDCSFVLRDVVIGVGFHWERREDQRFAGELRFLFEGGRLTAVNVVPVETYLQSVISSEMSAEASPALLRAHAVISRSWLLAQLKAERGSGD